MDILKAVSVLAAMALWTLPPVDMLDEALRRLRHDPEDVIPDLCPRYFQGAEAECDALLAELFP